MNALSHLAAGLTDSFLSSAETPVLLMDTSVRRGAGDAGVRRVRAYAKRANSEDSIEVLSTTESIFPDDLTAITEEDAEQQQPLTNGFDNEDESVTEEKILNSAPGDNETENEASDHKDDSGVDQEKPLKQVTKEPTSESVKKNQGHEDKSPVKTPKLQRGKTHICHFQVLNVSSMIF